MSKQYIKTTTGKETVAKPKIKVFKSITDLETAISNNEVEEGELVTTEFTDNGAGGDIAADLNWLADGLNNVKEILDDMDLDSKQNVNLSHTIAGGNTVEDALDRLTNIAGGNTTNITTINSKIPSAASSSNKLVAQSELPVYTLDTVTSTLTITLN